MINALLISNEIKQAPWGARVEIINRYAAQLGVSADTIYRKIRKKNGASKKVTREATVSEALVDAVARKKVKGLVMGLKERELSTEICLELLVNEGFEEAGNVSVSSVNRLLKKAGFREKEVIVRVEASYANEQHQLDFSRSKYFQLWKYDKGAGDYVLRIATQLSYKQDDHKLRTWLVGVTDAHSRVSLARAVPATGESALIGIEFLNFAYNRPADEHPMRYIPDTLKTDNGAFIKNESVKEMLGHLDINSEKVIPYKKRGIQKVESLWKKIWKRFELRLAVQLGDRAAIYLDEYNDLLHDFMVNQLSEQHPVKNESCGHVYRASLSANPPRVIEVDLKEVAFRVIERRVGDDLIVSINTEKFEAPPFAIGQRIRVYKNLKGEAVGELVDEFHKPFLLTPTTGYVELGDYAHRAPATYRQGIEAELKESEVRSQKSEGKIKYLPTREEKFEPETKFTEAVAEAEDFATVYDAKVYIGKHLPGEETYEDYAEIFQDFFDAGNLNKKEIGFVLEEIKTKEAYG